MAKRSPNAQRVFNELKDYMIKNQSLFQHPEGPILHKKHWETIAHNAAWKAADSADMRL